VCAALLLASPLPAQTPAAPETAEALFEAGVSARDRGDYAAARQSFQKSQALEPAPGTLLNLALCEEKLGKPASAVEHLEQVLRALPAGDDRAPIARARLDAIRPLVPRLTVSLTPGAPGETTVTLDGAELPAAKLGIPIPLDPGPHVVVASAPGRAPGRREGTVVAGDTLVWPVAPGDPLPVAPPGPAPAASGSALVVAGLAVDGIGLAALVMGVATGILTIQAKSTVNADCNLAREVCRSQAGIDASNRGRVLATVSTVGFAVGLAGVGAGTAMLIIGKRAQPKAAVGPGVVSGGAGIVAAGIF
jgi:hypothetical protein